MSFVCGACGTALVEGKGDFMANMDGGPPAMRTPFTCPSCAKSYSRWVQRPFVPPGVPGEERVMWIPEEPRSSTA